MDKRVLSIFLAVALTFPGMLFLFSERGERLVPPPSPPPVKPPPLPPPAPPGSMLIVNYHKTGFAAVNLLKNVLQNVGFRVRRSNKGDARREMPASRVQSWCNRGGMLNWWAADVVYLDPEQFGHKCFSSVLHFVRHPALWAVSFYDYHSQTPTPSGEAWSEEERDVCKLQPAFGRMHSNLAPELDALQVDCYERFNQRQSLYLNLQGASESDGIRLALYFLLFGGAQYNVSGYDRIVGGDIMRAAANAEWFNRSGVHVILVDTDALVQQQHATISHAVEQMADFSPQMSRGTMAQRVHENWEKEQTAQMSNAMHSKHITSYTSGASLLRKRTLACSLIRGANTGPVIQRLTFHILGHDSLINSCE